jgi:hypothetical protein
MDGPAPHLSFFVYPIYLRRWIRPSNAAALRELNANA